MLVAAAWMIQIHLLQRRNNGTGFATRQEKREHRAGCRDKQHRRNAGLSLRQTNNLTVIKTHGAIQHDLIERRTCALRGARAALEGLGDLGAIAVIGQH